MNGETSKLSGTTSSVCSLIKGSLRRPAISSISHPSLTFSSQSLFVSSSNVTLLRLALAAVLRSSCSAPRPKSTKRPRTGLSISSRASESRSTKITIWAQQRAGDGCYLRLRLEPAIKPTYHPHLLLLLRIALYSGQETSCPEEAADLAAPCASTPQRADREKTRFRHRRNSPALRTQAP
jgi:hypothetical protein